jgi:hypothetical protein
MYEQKFKRFQLKEVAYVDDVRFLRKSLKSYFYSVAKNETEVVDAIHTHTGKENIWKD